MFKQSPTVKGRAFFLHYINPLVNIIMARPKKTENGSKQTESLMANLPEDNTEVTNESTTTIGNDEVAKLKAELVALRAHSDKQAKLIALSMDVALAIKSREKSYNWITIPDDIKERAERAITFAQHTFGKR